MVDDGLNEFINALGSASGLSDAKLREAIRADAYLTDSLLHIELGNPEHIFVLADAKGVTSVGLA